MKAIIQTDLSNPRALEWADAPDPVLEDGQVLVKVKAAGVNRADLLQAAGHYPPPKGVTDILGLECAGVIEQVKGDSAGWKVGDEVCCLLSGGAYAEKVAVPAGQILPLPEGYSFTEAASIVEVACTVFSNVVMVAGLKEGDLLLVHGGAGGIGTFAIQMAKQLGARVAVTAGSAEKLAKCKELGADILINYKEDVFEEVIAAEGGADVILDIMGAKYLDRNVKALAKDGHLIIIGMQGGVKGELNIGRLLNKRGSITATGLRYRDVEDKARIVNATEDTVWPMLADGTVIPQIHEVMDIRDAAKAHDLLDSGAVTGKIILTV
ncbi:MAG: NAD(P)H-quinone oxidoreductase [Corynebacterium sp.]|uniref:NAD(P)H-quinone oxidoreductase n=1 Tax=Corynebacterium sp. TaxID=1720 RepID=UPI0026DB68C9|nr:NAD(P)H-quinone oxidoreductase [Corynebacterium sp.]MDO5030352.1 NAD(P)H-quinone oxidoreductase [Corynebacterium sp.]